jgi:hypothetical protein
MSTENKKRKNTKIAESKTPSSLLHSFFPAGLRGTCLVFFFYIVINWFGSALAAIA